MEVGAGKGSSGVRLPRPVSRQGVGEGLLAWSQQFPCWVANWHGQLARPIVIRDSLKFGRIPRAAHAKPLLSDSQWGSFRVVSTFELEESC